MRLLKILLGLAFLLGMTTSIHASSIPHQPAVDRCVSEIEGDQTQYVVGVPTADGGMRIIPIKPLPHEFRRIGDRSWILKVNLPEQVENVSRRVEGGVSFTVGHEFKFYYEWTGENSYTLSVSEGYPPNVYHERLLFLAEGNGGMEAYAVDLCVVREAWEDEAVVVALDIPVEPEYLDLDEPFEPDYLEDGD